MPSLPQLVEDAEVDVRQQRRDDATLGCPRERHRLLAVFHHAGFEPHPHQLEDSPVRDTHLHELHEPLVIDAAEVVADVDDGGLPPLDTHWNGAA